MNLLYDGNYWCWNEDKLLWQKIDDFSLGVIIGRFSKVPSIGALKEIKNSITRMNERFNHDVTLLPVNDIVICLRSGKVFKRESVHRFTVCIDAVLSSPPLDFLQSCFNREDLSILKEYLTLRLHSSKEKLRLQISGDYDGILEVIKRTFGPFAAELPNHDILVKDARDYRPLFTNEYPLSHVKIFLAIDRRVKWLSNTPIIFFGDHEKITTIKAKGYRTNDNILSWIL